MRIIYNESDIGIDPYRGRPFGVAAGESSGEMDPLVDATDEAVSGAGGGNKARTFLEIQVRQSLAT